MSGSGIARAWGLFACGKPLAPLSLHETKLLWPRRHLTVEEVNKWQLQSSTPAKKKPMKM
jgi:hypothetical protein